MQNLANIEAIYNLHVKTYDRAFADDKDFLIEYEEGFLNGMEEVLDQLGIDYEIGIFGYITIERN